MSLLTDDEISKMVKPYGSDSIMGFDHVKAFTRAIEAAILAKLGAMELPEPVVQRTKESKEKTLDDWFYASNPAYAKVHSSWKWEGLHTSEQLHQAYAQGAAAQLAHAPSGYLWAPKKKPELAKLAFQPEPSVQLKALGYVSEPLYTRREAK